MNGFLQGLKASGLVGDKKKKTSSRSRSKSKTMNAKRGAPINLEPIFKQFSGNKPVKIKNIRKISRPKKQEGKTDE